ncbi:C_GCAxxG_C_C family protein [bacterium]|nr:C_GCAxxG_C_C family protein [bacterium]
MKDSALEYFKNWYSCSESIVKAAVDKGYCSEDLVKVATPFSGGMSSGCLCGAVAGAQIVIGAVFDREDARLMAKDFIKRFTANNKVTCCRVLSHGLDRGSAERRELCKNYVANCAEILEDMIKNKIYVQS